MLEVLEYQDFDARMIIKISSIESSFEKVELPFETLLEEIKPEAIGKSVIEDRQTSKKITTREIVRVLIQKTD